MIVIINPKIVIGQETGNRSMLSGLECVPAGTITITDFKDPKAPKKDWKIVVGREFKYEGQKPSSGQWTWAIGTDAGTSLSNTWSATFTPEEAGIEENKGKGIIPKTALPLNNSDFGSTRGKVKVSNVLTEKGDADVKVFFLKDEKNELHAPTEPNWFYYWKQALPSLEYNLPLFNTENPTSPNFENFQIQLKYDDTGKFKWNPGIGMNYGLTDISPSPIIPIDPTNPSGPRYAFGYDLIMTLGEGTALICGHKLQEDLSTGEIKVLSGTGNTGISCFYQVYVHEMFHIEIWKDNYPLGFRTDQDSDFDGYSDDFEIRYAAYGFKNGTNDSYKNGVGSIGYNYEEKICRAVEDASVPSTISSYDWSFEPKPKIIEGRTQGKNW